MNAVLIIAVRSSSLFALYLYLHFFFFFKSLQIFLGQVMGTAAGTHLFLQFGWRPAAAFSLGLYAFQICVLLCRGPHCGRYTWLGYEGGLESRKSVVEARNREKEAQDAKEAEEGATARNSRSEQDEKTQPKADSEKSAVMSESRADVEAARSSGDEKRGRGSTDKRPLEEVV